MTSVSEETVDPMVLRRTLQAHAAGVCVVTTAGPDGPVGITATSFTPVSLDPPLVSFCLGRQSSTWPAFRTAEWFGVHVLGAHQQDVAERFAMKGIDRFAPPTRWAPGPHGVPLLDGTLAHLVCSRHAVLPIGDHYLVLGTVVAAQRGDDGPGLVHRHGRLQAVESAI